jgi:Gpi18-like mannosyltransferase
LNQKLLFAADKCGEAQSGMVKANIPPQSNWGHMRSRLLASIRQSYRAYHVYLSAILIFAASRLLVVIGIDFGRLLVQAPNPGAWDAGSAWYHRLLRWDSGWYAEILSDGYSYNRTVFFPLYPLLSRAVKYVFGIDQWLSLLLVANLSSLIVALVFVKLVKEEFGNELAIWSLALFLFFPSSLFLSAGYAESLCLLFILLSFILLNRQQFFYASLMAGFASATRSIGIVMIPVIIWEMARRNKQPALKFAPRLAVCGVLAASGLLIYMTYLSISFGHPLVFATAQAHWHTGGLLDHFVSGLTLTPFQNFKWDAGGWFLCFLILTLWSFRRLPTSLSLFALGSLMLPYLTLGLTTSMNRFVLMCFPAFISLALICNGQRLLTAVVIAMFASLLTLNAALFSQWYWVG